MYEKKQKINIPKVTETTFKTVEKFPCDCSGREEPHRIEVHKTGFLIGICLNCWEISSVIEC